MYIIRCLFVALLVALASAQPKDEFARREVKDGTQCVCDDGRIGIAWFAACPSGWAYCGKNGPPFTVCCLDV